MSNLKFVFALGVAALTACGTDPTASGVFPSEGFTGRTLRVEISGDATSWKDGATVSFGDGVTVGTVTVASPTDVFAEITIDGKAAPGLRDVTVSSDGSVTLKQAFELVTPVDLEFIGNADQGGYPGFKITSHDFDTPFDNTTDPDTGEFVNTAIMGPPGTNFQISAVDAYTITGFVQIDVDAQPGALDVMSGPAGNIIDSAAGTMDIGTRSAIALSSGTPMNGMLPKQNDSGLFSLDAAGSPSLVHLTAGTADPNGFPVTAILDSSGHWANTIGGSSAVLPSAGKVYIVVFDGGSASGYTYSLNATGEMLASGAEGDNTADNVKATTPNVASAVPYKMTGTLTSDAAEHDFIKFSVDAAHANKSLHIRSNFGNDPATDTQVEVIAGAAATSYTGGPVDGSDCSFFGCSDYGEEVLSDPLPQGNYVIDITAGANYDQGHQNYTIVFWFE